jgi:hypothetical protein
MAEGDGMCSTLHGMQLLQQQKKVSRETVTVLACAVELTLGRIGTFGRASLLTKTGPLFVEMVCRTPISPHGAWNWAVGEGVSLEATTISVFLQGEKKVRERYSFSLSLFFFLFCFFSFTLTFQL